MNFKPELVEKILAGQKTQTRRPVNDNPRSPWWSGGCSYRPGQVVMVNPGRGERAEHLIRLTAEPRIERLRDITESDARAEGFVADRRPGYPPRSARQRFSDYFLALPRSIALDPSVRVLDQRVWVVTFEYAGPR